MIGAFISMVREDEGASLVEYGLLVGLIALVVFTAAAQLGHSLDHVFDAARNAVRDSIGH